MATTVLDPSETPGREHGHLPGALAALSLFVIGAIARFATIGFSSGGLRGNYGYDPYVYYTAADALVHGQLPYRDFVLLHPPGVMLALVPFAWLGTHTTDLTGFVAGNLAFSLLGAATAALIYAAARRMGLPRSAAWLGGAFYAVWAGSVFVEVSSRLEPLSNFAFALGLVALTGGRPERARRNAALGGVALGFAFCVKIWWIVPLIVVALWLLIHLRDDDGKKRLAGFAAGAIGIVVVVYGPFFVLAPRTMIHMLVFAQTGRVRAGTPIWRLIAFSTVEDAGRIFSGNAGNALGIGFVVVVLGACALAWRVKAARFVAVLAVLHSAVLLFAPSFFTTYLDFIAVPLAVVLAAAAGTLLVRPLVAAIVAGAAVVTVLGLVNVPYITITTFPHRELASHRPDVKCVTAITPLPLVDLNVLSRNFDNGCRQWVDSYGRTYDMDKDGTLARNVNPVWQADLTRYLLSGNAIVMVRPDAALGNKLLDTLAYSPRITRTYSWKITSGSRVLLSVTVYRVAHN